MTTGTQVSDINTSAKNGHSPFKELEETAHRQGQILQNLPAAIYTCDHNGFIKWYNKAAVDLWGRTPEIGKDLWCGSWKIYEPDGITPLPLDTCPMAIALKEGHSVRGREIVVERPDGKRRNIMPYPDPIFNASGKLVEAVNMLVDITDLKLKEKALQESEERYKCLAQDLEAALRSEEEFISIASHELKTPVTSIKLIVDMLLEDANALNADEEAKYMLTRAQLQVDRLIRIIRELLDASKIKSGNLELNFEKVVLNDLVKDMVKDFTYTSATHIFNIHESGKVQVTCDKNNIEQVMNNLLTNAVKYSAAGSIIDITITENKKNIQVSIRDTGNGIPEELIPRIFDPFFRAHAEVKAMLSSIGLGLHISKDIITRHNGNIWVESVQGEGSVFHFTLPR